MDFPYHTESVSQHVDHFKPMIWKKINYFPRTELIFEPFPYMSNDYHYILCLHSRYRRGLIRSHLGRQQEFLRSYELIFFPHSAFQKFNPALYFSQSPLHSSCPPIIISTVINKILYTIFCLALWDFSTFTLLKIRLKTKTRLGSLVSNFTQT